MKEMQFSKAAQNYPPSGIRKMFDLAAKYPDAIKLTVGEPNFDTPAYIKEAAKKAMDAGETHYTPNAGMTVLRQAVAEKYQKAYWDGYTADHVMVTVGAMEGLMLTMMMLLDPGDEILVPDPCFPNYYGQASLTGAQAKPVPTYEENDYRMMAADIEKCITPHIKAFGKSSQEFAEELLTGAGVVTMPGSAFGACSEGYLRLVFANSDENLKEAVRRIDTYVRKTYPDMK